MQQIASCKHRRVSISANFCHAQPLQTVVGNTAHIWLTQGDYIDALIPKEDVAAACNMTLCGQKVRWAKLKTLMAEANPHSFLGTCSIDGDSSDLPTCVLGGLAKWAKLVAEVVGVGMGLYGNSTSGPDLQSELSIRVRYRAPFQVFPLP